MRGGANLLSQDDQLAVFLYDRGRTVIEDVGYALAGSHVHKGWGMRAISHAMVTVDEDIPTSQGYEFVPSADLVAFEDLGDVKVAEYSAPLSRIHQGATEYRRALVFCDVDEATSYALDLFLVAGGRIHDYAMNGPRFFEEDSGSYSMEGVDDGGAPRNLDPCGDGDGGRFRGGERAWKELGGTDRAERPHSGRGRTGRKPAALRMAAASRKRVRVHPRRQDRHAGQGRVRSLAVRRCAGHPIRYLVSPPTPRRP